MCKKIFIFPLKYLILIDTLWGKLIFLIKRGEKMTKADIVDLVFEKMQDVNKKQVTDWVEMVFGTLKDTLSHGEDIKISGFGNFKLRSKKARMGRNPRTGEPVEITARKVLTFRPSDILREIINKGSSANNPFAVETGQSRDPGDAGMGNPFSQQ